MVVCLWLLAIRFKAKSEELAITYDFPFLDPKFVLFDALTTVTALHLLAYQLTHVCKILLDTMTRELYAVVELKMYILHYIDAYAIVSPGEVDPHTIVLAGTSMMISALFSRLYNNSVVVLLGENFLGETDIVAGAMIFAFNILLAYICFHIVKRLKRVSAPFIVWSTIWSAQGVDARWERGIQGDLKRFLFFQRERSIGRAIMTTLFRLKSPWSVRSRSSQWPDGMGQLGELH
ncbi:hypothetical protein HD806DRAFT_488479 [Xylariaceae sp. AK1471]|nr:hypothetical protein HD806DRAFT_488479 [Xylariaceae sp. AK1471]